MLGKIIHHRHNISRLCIYCGILSKESRALFHDKVIVVLEHLKLRMLKIGPNRRESTPYIMR